MAETLGSLIDKLSIKSIREFFLKKMIGSKAGIQRQRLRGKLKLLGRQKMSLLKEIEDFVASAREGQAILRDEKLKLYNKPELMNKIGRIASLSRAIEALTEKNLQLWRLEDEARREDVPLSYIGKIKRKIDAANQQRNDLIDKIDELLEKSLKKR